MYCPPLPGAHEAWVCPRVCLSGVCAQVDTLIYSLCLVTEALLNDTCLSGEEPTRRDCVPVGSCREEEPLEVLDTETI